MAFSLITGSLVLPIHGQGWLMGHLQVPGPGLSRPSIPFSGTRRTEGRAGVHPESPDPGQFLEGTP